MRQRLLRSGFAVAPLVAVLSCTDQPPLGPASVPPNGQPSALVSTVSGVVRTHDAAGVRPAGSGQMSGWVEGYSAGTGHATGWIAIDTEGRYQFRVDAKTNPVSFFGGLYQPCVERVKPTGDTTVDIDIIRDPAQLGPRLPPELLSRLPLLSGVVFEQTSSGPRPLANVGLGLDGAGGLGAPVASTMTDDQGRYTFCAVPADIPELTLVSRLPGFQLTYVYGVSGKATVDIELRRIP